MVALLLLGGDRWAPIQVHAALPDFSGTWAYEPPASEAPAGDLRARLSARPPTGLCAARCTIVQQAGVLTVTRLARDDAPTTYRLDGVERRSQQRHPISTARFEVATRAVWEGATLTVYSTATVPRPTQMRMTLALVDDRLVIDSWIAKDGRTTARRLTYRRAGD